MMMNVFKIAFILLFLGLTTFALVQKPGMHKSFVMGDVYYVGAEQPQKPQSAKVAPQPAKPVVQEVQTAQKPQPKVIVQVIEETVKTQPKAVKTSTPSSIKTSSVQTSSANQKLIQRVVQNAESDKTKTTSVQQQKSKPVVQTVNVENKPLTEAEEIIAWNKWRSDLQNQVMRDSKISAPVGTKFNFSFTVDKYGNVSNINTWSDNAEYTPTAKSVIKPLILSYRNTAILKFPARTKRTIVNFEGGYTMSTSERYSSPDDYNDYERIKK